MMKRFFISTRSYASANKVKPHRKPIVYKEEVSHIETIRDRGFLRPGKPYEPPRDFKEIINSIVVDLGGVKSFKEKKFEFLTRCAAAFNDHFVPNSQLHSLKTIDDVLDFYSTPVNCQSPYEKLEQDVPNLHVIKDYKRYNPEDDGVSAFPKSSTLVTGLKYRKQYKGHIAKTSWP